MKNLSFLLFCILAFSCKGKKEDHRLDTEVVTTAPNNIIDPIKDSIVNPDSTILSKTDSVASDRLIVPAVRIGLTTINEKAESIGKKLGVPDAGDAAMGKAISRWNSKTDPKVSTVIYFTTNFGDKEEAKRVSQVRVSSHYFSTKEHIKVGSPFNEVSAAFPGAKLSGNYPDPADKQNIKVYDDTISGIAFELKNNICYGITVHKKGEHAFETYLNFFEGYIPIERKQAF